MTSAFDRLAGVAGRPVTACQSRAKLRRAVVKCEGDSGQTSVEPWTVCGGGGWAGRGSRAAPRGLPPTHRGGVGFGIIALLGVGVEPDSTEQPVESERMVWDA